jgi:hypothetical protein
MRTADTMKLIKLVFFFSTVIFISPLINAQSLSSIYNKGIIQVEKDWEIGGDVADENYIFAHITRICIDSEGKLFVLDTKDKMAQVNYGKPVKWQLILKVIS